MEHLAESRGCRPETDEYRRKSQDEKRRREENVAPRAGFAAGGDLLYGGSGNKRKIRRNERQHAGAQEGQETRKCGGRERDIMRHTPF
jgi:hypothetical protein